MRPRMIAAALSVLLFAAGWIGFDTLTPSRTEGISAGRIPTPYVRFSPPDPPVGQALLIHGLNSNKEFMQILAMALCDAGYEVWAIDLPGHGDSPVPFSYESSLVAIGTFLEQLGDAVVIGHSLGGALLSELAATERFKAVVLISPAPIPLEPFEQTRVLALSGGADAPGINDFMPELVEAAGPDAESRLFPAAAHSTTLFDPGKIQLIVDWIRLPALAARARTPMRLAWLGLMAAAGIAAPLFLAWSWSATASEPPAAAAHPEDWKLEVVGWVAAVGISMVTLRFVALFDWLHLFATDYLIGTLFLTGLILWRGRVPALTLRSACVGLIGAAWVFLLMAVVGSEVMHLVPSGGQWFRVPVLAAVCLPLALHDEQTLRPIRPTWKRWLMFGLTRAVLWAGVVTGVLLLNPESSFLVIVAHYFVVYWVVLWWASGVVARTTGKPAAAAVFSSLVQGWVFAAVFVSI